MGKQSAFFVQVETCSMVSVEVAANSFLRCVRDISDKNCYCLSRLLASSRPSIDVGVNCEHTKKTQVADTLYSLGVCVRRNGGQKAEIAKLFQRALKIYEIYENASSAVSDDHGSKILEKTEMPEIADNKATLGKDNCAKVAAASHELGMCILGEEGQEEEAVRLLKRALQIREEKLGPDDVQVI